MDQIDGITNFRDIGGCHLEKGKLASGYFYRSGQLDTVTDEQKNFLRQTCHIKKIFDFRSAEEVANTPDQEIEGIQYQHIDILASATENGASLTAMLDDLAQVDQNMMETYTQIVMSDSAHRGYHDFLMQLLAKKEPILFHCFAGKDRTGFAAALILSIAGASNADVMHDYLQTNSLRKEANQQLLAQFQSQYNAEELKQLEVALRVDPRYLTHAYNLIQQKYGSLDRYFREALKLPKDYVENFRHTYVVQ